MILQDQKSLKGLPVGVDSFEDLVNNDYYYVDKTIFIKSVMNDNKSKVLLITRPRRFGKSLTLDTIYSFLNINDPANPQDCSYQKKLFASTKILEDQDFCESFMGKFPVISLSFKEVDGDDYNDAYRLLAKTINATALQFEYLLDSPKISSRNKTLLEPIMDPRAIVDPIHRDDLCLSLQTLSTMLFKHYCKNVVVLIDEYDVPLAHAYAGGYYDKMVKIIRGIFSAGVKGNKSLHKAVLTGCLRVSKDSIFTGLNNLKINTVANDTGTFAECMGFNEAEIKTLLGYYGLSEHEQAVKNWYDGYRICKSEVFCPWDVINFCDTATDELRHGNPVSEPKSYWSSTSTTDIILQFMNHLNKNDAERMQTLMDGGEIEFLLNEQLNYNEIGTFHRSDDFWTLLLYTGYLTAVSSVTHGETTSCTARIPNLEIRSAFEKNIKDYYSSESQQNSSNAIVNAFFKGDCEEIRTLLEEKLTTYVSVRDLATKATPENFYHGFLNGIFSVATQTLKDFKSNAEAGNGYADIIFTSPNNRDAVIIEIKSVAKNEEKLSATQNGLKQIEGKQYIRALSKENSDIKRVWCYGIAFCKKECLVRHTIKTIAE